MNQADELAQRQKAQYQTKNADASTKITDVDTKSRTVTGFFGTFNYLDSKDEVLLKGCATKSINERGPKSLATGKIKHLLHHNPTLLPGSIKALEETTKSGITGLYFETKMTDTQLGRDTITNYEEGVYDNHSIGFIPTKMSLLEKRKNPVAWDKVVSNLINPQAAANKDYLFLVNEMKLYEGSTVSMGANEFTPFLGLKSGGYYNAGQGISERIDLLQKQLKHGTQSDETMYGFEILIQQLKQLTADGFSQEPSEKDTFSKSRPQSDTQAVKFDVLKAIEELTIFKN